MKNSFRIAVLIVVILAMLCMLCACDNVSSDTSTYTYYLRVTSVEKSGDDVLVRLAIGQDDEKTLENVGVECVVQQFQRNAFYDEMLYTFNFHGKAIFSAVDKYLQQYGSTYGVTEYSNLKIVFDYVTIYKSAKSNGDVNNVDGKYVHTFTILNLRSSNILYRLYPHASTWYAIVIGVASFALIVIIVVLVVKKRKKMNVSCLDMVENTLDNCTEENIVVSNETINDINTAEICEDNANDNLEDIENVSADETIEMPIDDKDISNDDTNKIDNDSSLDENTSNDDK